MQEKKKKIEFEKSSFEEVWAMSKQTEKKLDKMIESDEKRKIEMQESDEKRKREMQELHEKTQKEIKDTQREIKDTQRVVKELSRNIGGLNNSIGEVAEVFFSTAIKDAKILKVDNVKYDFIEFNVGRIKGDLQVEYDIMLINSSSILIIETKHKIKTSDIEKFVEVQLPRFKNLYPEFNTYTVRGGLASMSFSMRCQKLARENNLLMLTQSQDGNIKILK